MIHQRAWIHTGRQASAQCAVLTHGIQTSVGWHVMSNAVGALEWIDFASRAGGRRAGRDDAFWFGATRSAQAARAATM